MDKKNVAQAIVPDGQKSAAVAAKSDYSKQVFYSSVLSLSWQLAATVIVPVVIGFVLDKSERTKPLYTLIGLGIGVLAAVVVVWQTLRRLQHQLLSEETSKV